MNNNLLIVGSRGWAKQAEEIAKVMGCYEKIEILSNEEMGQNEFLRNIESKAGEFSYGIAVSESDVERQPITQIWVLSCKADSPRKCHHGECIDPKWLRYR